jgi:hypothetical protein
MVTSNCHSNGKILELNGRLHADLFNSNKMLINGVDMNIKLTRHHKLFILWLLQTTTNCVSRFYTLIFSSLMLNWMPIILAQANVFGTKHKAHYPPLADLCLPVISYMFACNKNFKHVFALGTAYSLAQWLNFYILSLLYAYCPTQPAYHWGSPDDGVCS